MNPEKRLKPITMWRGEERIVGHLPSTEPACDDSIEKWREFRLGLLAGVPAAVGDIEVYYNRIQNVRDLDGKDVASFLAAYSWKLDFILDRNMTLSEFVSIPAGTRITPNSLFNLSADVQNWTEVNAAKYRKMVYDLLFSYRIDTTVNDNHRELMRGRAIEQFPAYTHVAGMKNAEKSDFLPMVAAYDWFLELQQHKEQKLRFGTVTTRWMDMGAVRDLSFLAKLFPQDPTRPIAWSTNNVVVDSMMLLMTVSDRIGTVGNVFPYLKSLGLVKKSNMSITAHAAMHDYIHSIGCFKGAARSLKSKLVQPTVERSDVLMAAMCVMATGAIADGPVIVLDEDKQNTRMYKEMAQAGAPLDDSVADHPLAWQAEYKLNPQRILSWIDRRIGSLEEPRENTILAWMKSSQGEWGMN